MNEQLIAFWVFIADEAGGGVRRGLVFEGIVLVLNKCMIHAKSIKAIFFKLLCQCLQDCFYFALNEKDMAQI